MYGEDGNQVIDFIEIYKTGEKINTYPKTPVRTSSSRINKQSEFKLLTLKRFRLIT